METSFRNSSSSFQNQLCLSDGEIYMQATTTIDFSFSLSYWFYGIGLLLGMQFHIGLFRLHKQLHLHFS